MMISSKVVMIGGQIMHTAQTKDKPNVKFSLAVFVYQPHDKTSMSHEKKSATINSLL